MVVSKYMCRSFIIPSFQIQRKFFCSWRFDSNNYKTMNISSDGPATAGI